MYITYIIMYTKTVPTPVLDRSKCGEHKSMFTYTLGYDINLWNIISRFF